VPTGLLLWITAMILAVTGLVSVLRFRILIGGLLITSGLALGLFSTRYLN
jgi:hypothetical protein